MMFFITVLRALAACLITNAHYTGIYPTDLIANGGLLGDVIFFAVSGYCLYHVKTGFGRWYGKRIVRCYLPVLLVTAMYMIVGLYRLEGGALSVFRWFVYPTEYHFVASIILLYVPYYIVMKTRLKEHLLPVMAAVFVLYLLSYLFFFDASYYHIDTVREPMIRFLFMESMFLGAYFRQRDEYFRNRFRCWLIPLLLLGLAAYFVSKKQFASVQSISEFQIMNQLILMAALYLVFRLFAALDNALERMPAFLKTVISFISGLTLEIYIVQNPLIALIRPYLPFPVNWIAVTAAIIAAAVSVHWICQRLLALGDKIGQWRNRKETRE